MPCDPHPLFRQHRFDCRNSRRHRRQTDGVIDRFFIIGKVTLIGSGKLSALALFQPVVDS